MPEYAREPGVIEIWQVRTDISGDELRALRCALSPDERARADGGGWRTARWAAGRAALREILSSYVGGDPAAMAFEPGPYGKPSLPGGPHFSFSRSGRLAFVAVAGCRPVGVDVQRVRPGRPVERIARSRFAPVEADAVVARDPSERPVAFHRCWTGKEAYAKGLGEGLSVGLERFSVAGLLAGGRDRCTVEHPERATISWEVQRLPAPEGYEAAVAAPGSDWRVDVRPYRRAARAGG